MANTRPTRTYPGSTPYFELVRSEDLALPVAAEEAPGADEVDAAALSLTVRADGELTPDGRFRWSAVWGRWVPTGREETDLPGPLEFGPLMPERLHPRGCWCVECWNTGLRYGEYLKAKQIRESNGF